MIKKISVLFVMLSIICPLYAQKDMKPDNIIKEYIKKEHKKYGFWDFKNEKWEIQPEYDNITAASFTDKSYDRENHVYYKLWKGNTFDLMKSGYDKKDRYLTRHTIMVKDIEAFTWPEFGNFTGYLKNGKWGWILNAETEICRFCENYVVNPLSQNPPVYLPPSYMIIDSANFKGLYTYSGLEVIKPGPYKSFQLLKGGYLLIEGINGLKGLASVSFGGGSYDSQSGTAINTVSSEVINPMYVSISTKTFQSNDKKEFFNCLKPDNNYDLREGTHLLTEKETAGIMNTETDLMAKQKRNIQELNQWLRDLKFVLENNLISIKNSHGEVLPGSAKSLSITADYSTLKVFTNEKGDSLFATTDMSNQLLFNKKEINLSELVNPAKTYEKGEVTANVVYKLDETIANSGRNYLLELNIPIKSHDGNFNYKYLHVTGNCPLCQNSNYIRGGWVKDTTIRNIKTKVSRDAEIGYKMVIDGNGNVYRKSKTVQLDDFVDKKVTSVNEIEEYKLCPLTTTKKRTEYYPQKKDITYYEHDLVLEWNEGKKLYFLSKLR